MEQRKEQRERGGGLRETERQCHESILTFIAWIWRSNTDASELGARPASFQRPFFYSEYLDDRQTLTSTITAGIAIDMMTAVLWYRMVLYIIIVD